MSRARPTHLAFPHRKRMMPPVMKHFFDFTPCTLASFLTERGLPRFAAKQVIDWVYQKNVVNPHEMTNLSKAARDSLDEEIVFCEVKCRASARNGRDAESC
jgi:adenine C2-methylase RlmN of 23S rRNA A2503 and tRNA A37